MIPETRCFDGEVFRWGINLISLPWAPHSHFPQQQQPQLSPPRPESVPFFPPKIEVGHADWSWAGFCRASSVYKGKEQGYLPSQPWLHCFCHPFALSLCKNIPQLSCFFLPQSQTGHGLPSTPEPFWPVSVSPEMGRIMGTKDVVSWTLGMLCLQELHWVGCSFGLSVPVWEEKMWKNKNKQNFKNG